MGRVRRIKIITNQKKNNSQSSAYLKYNEIADFRLNSGKKINNK